jgi:hypothetical protein
MVEFKNNAPNFSRNRIAATEGLTDSDVTFTSSFTTSSCLARICDRFFLLIRKIERPNKSAINSAPIGTPMPIASLVDRGNAAFDGPELLGASVPNVGAIVDNVVARRDVGPDVVVLGKL